MACSLVGASRTGVEIHQCRFKLKGLKGAAYGGSRVKLPEGKMKITSSPFDVSHHASI